MKVVIVSSSPRKAFSTSLYFSRLLRLFLRGTQTTVLPLKTAQDYAAVVQALPGTDALVFASPVYVDTLPSTTLEHLKRLERQLAGSGLRFRVYAMVNCGFYEGRQCACALNTYALWCRRAGVDWCGGIGVGSGVMLGFLRLLPVLGLAVTGIGLLARGLLLSVGSGFSLSALLSGYLPITLLSQTALWLLFSLGAFLHIFRLRAAVAAGRPHPVRFTTVWFCPRPLFVAMASLYWVLRALLLHGVPPWRLFRKNPE